MIVLDTHVLIWWVNGDTEKISPKAQTTIQNEISNGEIIISSISAWEIAMLVNKECITLSMDLEQWLLLIEQIETVKFYAIDNEIALKSTQLPGEFHKDPADRMIVATARKLGATLISADEKILKYPHVKVIW